MKIHYDRSFLKSVSKIKDPTTLIRVYEVICRIEQLETIKKLNGTKKITGYSEYYRIKIGDYRIGFEKISHDEIRLILAAHRKDIYNRFP